MSKQQDKRWVAALYVLKKERTAHLLNQITLAEKLGEKQSYVSKTESGDRRLDVIELLDYCDAIGVTLTDFVFRMEGRLLAEGLLSPARKQQYIRWLGLYYEYYKQFVTKSDIGELEEFCEVSGLTSFIEERILKKQKSKSKKRK